MVLRCADAVVDPLSVGQAGLKLASPVTADLRKALRFSDRGGIGGLIRDLRLHGSACREQGEERSKDTKGGSDARLVHDPSSSTRPGSLKTVTDHAQI